MEEGSPLWECVFRQWAEIVVCRTAPPSYTPRLRHNLSCSLRMGMHELINSPQGCGESQRRVRWASVQTIGQVGRSLARTRLWMEVLTFDEISQGHSFHTALVDPPFGMTALVINSGSDPPSPSWSSGATSATKLPSDSEQYTHMEGW